MQTTERQDIADQLAMVTEGIAATIAAGEEPSAKQLAAQARYTEQLLALGDSDGRTTMVPDGTGTGTARALHALPQAGAPASNQYGTFTVRYASAKQTAFIKGLLDRKDTSSLADSVTLDVAKLRQQVEAQQVNLKAASAIITRLLALPDAPRSATTPSGPVRPASDKQVAFLVSLAAERTPEVPAERITTWAAQVESKIVSDKITELLALPKAKVAPRDIEAGVYTDGTTTYRVYLGQNSGQMLAAKVVEHDGHAEFDYAGKADRFVTAAFRKLTIEEAAKFGKATGTCIVCARRLDVPESVDRGIGPVCFAKMGG